MTLSGDIAGEYVVEDRRPDGRLVLVPDTSATAIRARGGSRRLTAPEWQDLSQSKGPTCSLQTTRGSPCPTPGIRCRHGSTATRGTRTSPDEWSGPPPPRLRATATNLAACLSMSCGRSRKRGRTEQSCPMPQGLSAAPGWEVRNGLRSRAHRTRAGAGDIASVCATTQEGHGPDGLPACPPTARAERHGSAATR